MRVSYPICEEEVLGFIPARGGSKSIPLKNIVPVAGVPLIVYSIKAAKLAPSLQRILCSTDHEGIASVCRAEGIDVMERPASLGEDDTPVAAVIVDVLERLGQANGSIPGLVALIQPTSPFLLPEHIEACVQALQEAPDAQSAQTVSAVFHNAHAFNQRVIENGRVRFRFLEERRAAYNKQRKPKHYTFGNLVVTRSTHLLGGGDFFGDISVPVEIPRAYAFDVDTAEDIDYASYLVQEGKVRTPSDKA